jgi:hypothetical protein
VNPLRIGSVGVVGLVWAFCGACSPATPLSVGPSVPLSDGAAGAAAGEQQRSPGTGGVPPVGPADAGVQPPPADAPPPPPADASPPSPSDAGVNPPRADASPPSPEAGSDAGSGSRCPPTATNASVPAACLVTPVDAPECTIAPMAIAPPTLCPNEQACPATMLLQLGCSTDNVVSLDARGIDGAYLLVNEGPDIDLYTLGQADAQRAQRFPLFVNSTVRTDPQGAANIFVQAGQPGVWRVRETPQGWAREDVQAAPSGYADVVDARIIDDTYAVAAIDDGQGISLFARDTAGWRPTLVDAFMGHEVLDSSAAMNIDGVGQPWLAGVTYHDVSTNGQTPTSFLDVVGPDGTLETVRSLVGDVPIAAPIVLPGGLAGTGDRPAVAYQQGDGVHVAVPATAPMGWSDRLMPGSAPWAIVDTTCPGPNGVPSPCPGASCTAHARGTTGGLGFARAASGAAFVAWLDSDTTMSMDLVGSPFACGAGAPVSSQGTSTIVVARVPLDPSTPLVVQRFQLEGGAVPSSMMSMTARGDTLLIAAQATAVSSSTLWYLEVDSTQLP